MNLLKRVRLRLWEGLHFARYATPNVLTPQVSSSSKAREWLEQMRSSGIVKIEEEKFSEVAGYLNSKYFSKLEGGCLNLEGRDLGSSDLFAVDVNDPRYEKWGVEIKCVISFKDPVLSQLVLHSDLTNMLYNYFKRQPYYRNQPVLQKVSYREGQDPQGDDSFHVDNLHQISVMLLISDQTERDTHMEYALGSNRRPVLRQGIYISHAEARERARDFPIFKCIGKKGTLFVFDTSGIHRRYLLPGNPRKMLHLNVTTGHHMAACRENLKNWRELAISSAYVQRMFTKFREANT